MADRVYYVTENYPTFPGGGDPVTAPRLGDTDLYIATWRIQ